MANNTSDINSILEEFFAKLNIEAKFDIKEEPELIKINIDTPDTGLLIGRGGEMLMAVSYILKIMIKNNVNLPLTTKISIDIANYREENQEKLISLAKNLAQKVALTGNEEILRPMAAYERRIIHMALSDDKNVITDSIGDGLDRRVIIKHS